MTAEEKDKLWTIAVCFAIFFVICILCRQYADYGKAHDPNPFAVGDKVVLMGKVGVVSESFTAFGEGVVKVRFLLTGPEGEHFETVVCKSVEIQFAETR